MHFFPGSPLKWWQFLLHHHFQLWSRYSPCPSLWLTTTMLTGVTLKFMTTILIWAFIDDSSSYLLFSPQASNNSYTILILIPWLTLYIAKKKKQSKENFSGSSHYHIHLKAFMFMLSLLFCCYGNTVCVFFQATPTVIFLIQCSPHAKGHRPDLILTISYLTCIFFQLIIFICINILWNLPF